MCTGNDHNIEEAQSFHLSNKWANDDTGAMLTKFITKLDY